jgi:DNA-binding LacI/PurR family transcriptional regulator
LQDITNPYVLINIIPEKLNCDSISVDRAIGADLAVTHLLEQGYNDIYFFYTYKYMAQSRRSVQGCQSAFNKHKRSKSSLKMIYCENHEMETFYKAAKENLKYSDQKMGIFVWDDEMAIGVYRAVVEHGWDIPNQIGLIGFDDIKISRYLPKALTTIRYPKDEMGKQSAERLIQCLNSRRKFEPKKVTLNLELVRRETT